MARTRRSVDETLELKIELAEKKVAKTREANEKAIDELKKLYDIRRAKQKDLILKAIENIAHSFDEILAFINSPGNDEEEADA